MTDTLDKWDIIFYLSTSTIILIWIMVSMILEQIFNIKFKCFFATPMSIIKTKEDDYRDRNVKPESDLECCPIFDNIPLLGSRHIADNINPMWKFFNRSCFMRLQQALFFEAIGIQIFLTGFSAINSSMKFGGYPMGIDIYQISIIFILTYIFLIVPVIIVSYVEIYPICEDSYLPRLRGPFFKMRSIANLLMPISL